MNTMKGGVSSLNPMAQEILPGGQVRHLFEHSVKMYNIVKAHLKGCFGYAFRAVVDK